MRNGRAAKTIWIDMDNSPHVLLFDPVIKALRERGHQVVLTARDAFQVRGLIEQFGMDAQLIGHHSGKNKIRKILGLVHRAQQLSGYIRPLRPDLAISHGSRSQLILCKALNINTLYMTDYEFSKLLPFAMPRHLLLPRMLEGLTFGVPDSRVAYYDGIKEDIYVPGFQAAADFRQRIGVGEEDILVTIRPPATEAHYHNPKSDLLFEATMKRLVAEPRVRIFMLPRSDQQKDEIRRDWQNWIPETIIIPEKPVGGLDLIWHSDLVISGGGTMNREAAALNVPVYSIFRGHIGRIDQYLAEAGKLVLLENPEDTANIDIRRREHSPAGAPDAAPVRMQVVDHIESLLEVRA